ncbi:hypothetical protein QQP08_022989 [Theobroma cacao]|nr:hypothetical protein QQP08_022989 [Theobroma cacao]
MKPYNSSSNSPYIDMEMGTVAVAQGGQKRSRKGGFKNGKAKVCGDAGDQSVHEMHIWTERERRKKMRNMFSSLHALLPQLPAKGPSNNYPMTTDVSQTFPAPISPACFQTWFSPNVVINMCGDDAQVSVCSPRKPGVLTTIMYILEKHQLEVVSAHISSDQYRSMYMIHVHADGASDQFSEAVSVEETFKLAAGEMNLWLLSC